MTAPSEPMRVSSPTLHATVLFSMAVFVAVVVMSFVFEVEVVARGEGRLVPVTRVQVVQPEFPGRLSDIRVTNGMSVAAGDVLITLDPTDAVADLGRVRAERDRLSVEMLRIAAMAGALGAGAPFADLPDRALALFRLPGDLAAHPVAQEQRDLLLAQASDLLAALAQIDARQEAGLKSEEVTRAGIAQVDAALAVQGERLRISEQLLAQGTTSRAAFLDVQQLHVELEREREVFLRELDRKTADRAALASERRRLLSEVQRTLLERRSQVETRLAILAEEERSAARVKRHQELTPRRHEELTPSILV